MSNPPAKSSEKHSSSVSIWVRTRGRALSSRALPRSWRRNSFASRRPSCISATATATSSSRGNVLWACSTSVYILNVHSPLIARRACFLGTGVLPFSSLLSAPSSGSASDASTSTVSEVPADVEAASFPATAAARNPKPDTSPPASVPPASAASASAAFSWSDLKPWDLYGWLASACENCVCRNGSSLSVCSTMQVQTQETLPRNWLTSSASRCARARFFRRAFLKRAVSRRGMCCRSGRPACICL
mmetsp:Transcript_13133/g.30463  ORF Transcript_13133/g.30463 Transcript_13133/m.30463 type:complete len:246 (+) Transcript_13133:852-1589(+)